MIVRVWEDGGKKGKKVGKKKLKNYFQENDDEKEPEPLRSHYGANQKKRI